MLRRKHFHGIMVSVIVVTFVGGYFCGSLSQPQAAAQSGIGGVLEKAGKIGGPVGSAAQLSSSIVEIQDHVNGQQKNIDSLKKFQAALTGK